MEITVIFRGQFAIFSLLWCSMPCPQHAWTREQAKKSNYPIMLTVILSIPAVFIAAFQQSPLPLAPSAVHVVSLIRCIDHQTFCSTYSWPKCLNFRVLVTWDISRCPGQLFCMVLYGTSIFFPLQIRNVRFRRFAISVIFRFSKKIGSVHTP